MKVIRPPDRMISVSRKLTHQGKTIGVVPTMGALHEGHRSLIQASVRQNDLTILTVFVNPLQFGPSEDFSRYPRPFRKDCRIAKELGVDFIFAPHAQQLYPKGFQTVVEVTALSKRWEGLSRPGHFRGVTTVVSLLFQCTQPTRAYFGQKDYQQALVIQRLVQDMRWPIKVSILPTIREADGLAMSSRNVYLKSNQRQQAASIYTALRTALERIRMGERNAAVLTDSVRRMLLENADLRIDYVALVDAKTLEPVWKLHGRVAILVAVWVGKTRLIDNLLVDVP
ncbi:MAG: pantoate--beta-alanine ligase [Candidatus Omnitrophica bacterium]|nr:pantoate--beta-alanine ligase [Candidatus Omnitrophota bacterium]MBI3010489.1 pantoate--beta-alanine ligase [Candidatus Omnitrophota bacterium]